LKRKVETVHRLPMGATRTRHRGKVAGYKKTVGLSNGTGALKAKREKGKEKTWEACTGCQGFDSTDPWVSLSGFQIAVVDKTSKSKRARKLKKGKKKKNHRIWERCRRRF